MTAINFPDSPSVNDTFTSNNRTWTWTGTVWLSSGTVGNTGPTGPTGASGEAYANIDGGSASSNYGGITAIDGGTSS